MKKINLSGKFSLIGILMILVSSLIGCETIDQNITAFIHVNLVPMTGKQVIPDQTVLISGSEIVSFGDFEEIQIPKNAEIIKGDGAYLFPGLADMHMHTRADWEDRDVWPTHPLSLYLANGVTTVRDFAPEGSPLTYALEWQNEIKAGFRIGPTIYASGKLIYASPLDDPKGIVQENYSAGFDFLKFYSYLSPEDFHQAMKKAKELGIYTTGHIPYTVGLDGVIAENMDEIAHIEELLYEFINFDRDQSLSPSEWRQYVAGSAVNQFDIATDNFFLDFKNQNQMELEEIVKSLRVNGTPVCTTLVIDDVIQLKLFDSESFLARSENIYFEEGYLDSYYLSEEKHQAQCKNMEEFCALKYNIDRWILNGLHEGGVLLLLGTDSGTGGMGIVPGYSIHDELDILVVNGFTPYEALVTGTVNAGIIIENLGGEGNIGTIEVGNQADLILTVGNPLEDVSTLRSPLGVMSDGRWYPAEFLTELIQP